MSPRTELVVIELFDSIAELKELFIETVILRCCISKLIGWYWLRIRLICFKKPKSIKSVVIPVEFVPETIYIKDIMNCLLKSEKVLVVLGWIWWTSGIITIEDIVEELLRNWRWTRFRWRIDRKELGDDTYIFRLDLTWSI
jgi:CBS domain containing-hemolysin-like protein